MSVFASHVDCKEVQQVCAQVISSLIQASVVELEELEEELESELELLLSVLRGQGSPTTWIGVSELKLSE